MPNRNNAPILDHVLERMARNTTYADCELIVVDDGSTDDSRAILRRWRESGRLPELRLIEREHSGVVEALNTGLAEASGALVVQLDADASLETPGWLERMVNFFLSDKRIGVVTGKVVFDWGELHTCGVDLIGPTGFHDRGAVITEPAGRRTYHQRVVRFPEGECADCETLAEVDGGIGCCMMYEPPATRAMGTLLHHYGYWREKWGFDLLNPDLDAVRARWGATEVCWNLNPDMRAAGQRIIAAYEAQHPRCVRAGEVR